MTTQPLLLSALVLFSVVVFIQDLRHRYVYLWVLAGYAGTAALLVYAWAGAAGLFHNLLFSLAYFVLIFGIIMLYYYIKEGALSNPTNTRIGAADLVLLPAAGITLEPAQMVIFFALFFAAMAMAGLLWYKKRGQTVPLAGWLCACHLFYYSCIYLYEKQY